jgi:hypothetical protein
MVARRVTRLLPVAGGACRAEVWAKVVAAVHKTVACGALENCAGSMLPTLLRE